MCVCVKGSGTPTPTPAAPRRPYSPHTPFPPTRARDCGSAPPRLSTRGTGGPPAASARIAHRTPSSSSLAPRSAILSRTSHVKLHQIARHVYIKTKTRKEKGEPAHSEAGSRCEVQLRRRVVLVVHRCCGGTPSWTPLALDGALPRLACLPLLWCWQRRGGGRTQVRVGGWRGARGGGQSGNCFGCAAAFFTRTALSIATRARASGHTSWRRASRRRRCR